jgi:hypothetical protein
MGFARPKAKTLIISTTIMVIAGLTPAFVLGLLGWTDGISVAALAWVSALIACGTGKGWRTGAVIAVPFALLAGLTVWAAPSPWWAAIVLGIAAFLRGYAARAGLHNALMMTVVSLGFLVSEPPQLNSVSPPIFAGLIVLGTTLWATLIFALGRKWIPRPSLSKLNPIRVVAYSLSLALLVGLATWFVVAYDLGHSGGWIILTIVVVFQPSLGAGFRKAGYRAAGTLGGFLIAILVGSVASSGPVIYALGAVFFIAALVVMLQGRPYWMYALLLTPAIVLLESGGSTVSTVAEERLGATMIGVLLTVLVMLLLTPLARYLEGKASAKSSRRPGDVRAEGGNRTRTPEGTGS